MVDVLPQRVTETYGGEADDFPMTGDVRERYAGDDALAAGRQIVKVPATRRRMQRAARYAAR
jgi:hypothetical protein